MRYRTFCILFLSILFLSDLNGQPGHALTADKTFQVVLSEVYTEEEFNSRNFWDKVNDLVFGKKSLSIQRPVAAIVDAQNMFWF